VRQNPEFFGDQELELLYIAKKLALALEMERVLTAASIDYAVEVNYYVGGFLFKRERAGAFFYVRPADTQTAREAAVAAGFSPAELQSHHLRVLARRG